MTDFTAKMHQIRFRLGSTLDPARGSSQLSPDLVAGFKAMGAGKEQASKHIYLSTKMTGYQKSHWLNNAGSP